MSSGEISERVGNNIVLDGLATNWWNIVSPIIFLIPTIYLLAYFYIKVFYVLITVQTIMFDNSLKKETFNAVLFSASHPEQIFFSFFFFFFFF